MGRRESVSTEYSSKHMVMWSLQMSWSDSGRGGSSRSMEPDDVLDLALESDIMKVTAAPIVGGWSREYHYNC